MPAITALEVISKAETLLQDTTNVRWSELELLGWLNDAQREVSMLRPDACSRMVNIALVAGTRQSLPVDGTATLRATRNMGAGGVTPGRAIRHVPIDLLDSNVPGWHSATATAEVLHVAVDHRLPRTFFVYPPSTGAAQIEMIYSAPPADVAALTFPGTYTQSLFVVTVTRAAHGMKVGDAHQFLATAGAGVSGFFLVASVPTTGTFTLVSTVSQTVTSSACTINPAINVDDVYASPMIDFVCFRAYSKDQELSGSTERASAHRALFNTSMDGKAQADATTTAARPSMKG